MMNGNAKKLCAGALGMSLGLVSGLSMMLLAWAGMQWGYATNIIDQWSSVYPGYAATVGGGIVGFFWGLLEGFIVGLIIGVVYNKIIRCCPCKTCCCNKSSCDIDKNKQ